MELTNEENLVIAYINQGSKFLSSNKERLKFIMRSDMTGIDKRKLSTYQSQIIKKLIKGVK